MTTLIEVWDLGANKHIIDQYAISNIYIPTKDSQGWLVTTYIWQEIYLVVDLKANKLGKTNIMIPK